MTGLEPIFMEAAKSLAGLSLKTVWDIGSVPIDKSIQQAFYKASGQYIKTYQKRHGILKVLGMSEPTSLEKIYITVQILDKQSLYRYRSIKALEEGYAKSGTLQEQNYPKQRGIDIVNAQPKYRTKTVGHRENQAFSVPS